MRIFRNILLIPLVLWVLIGPVSAYRAYFQIRGIEIQAPAELRPGTEVSAGIITSGRVDAMLVVELVQGTHREVIADVRVMRNRWPYWNVRSASATTRVTLSAERLARFTPGAALIHATGYGSPQWLRTPPPVERQVAVGIRMP